MTRRFAVVATMLACMLATPALARHQGHAAAYYKVTQYCGDRVCGFADTATIRKGVRAKHAAAYVAIDKPAAKLARKSALPGPDTPQVLAATSAELDRLVAEARHYLGAGPIFGRGNLWCARFVNFILARSGFKTSRSDRADSFARFGARVKGPEVGAIAYMEGNGPSGHVGIVTGVDKAGDPIVISGNFNNRVVEIAVPRKIVRSYVIPPRLAPDPAKAAAASAIEDSALMLAVAEARTYLVATATPGSTMSRQGAAASIDMLHPVFALRLAAAIHEARADGLDHAGVFSAYRPPAFGVGGFSDKYDSTHAYGLAADMIGIGAPGSAKSRQWHAIAVAHGLENPYFGTRRTWEFNHYQATTIKIVTRELPLRATIIGAGPIDRETMWKLGDAIIAPMQAAERATYLAALE